MDLDITFPGGHKVCARGNGFEIETDQPKDAGGDGSAPTPFDYFLASIGTCAGFYVQRFLTQRHLPTDGASLRLYATRDATTRMVTRIDLELVLDESVPKKYEPAILRAIDLCTVKKHLLAPPEVTTVLRRSSRGTPAESV